ncbi:type II toxin-antitoxin system VapC family toxin [Nodularia sp. NIES-3585]|uniref:type II toxin-antitoxin system VapC family toxin n=1 Tax=Nodularia sp. NIES-3585 TaxID=1973477 RepID=UPI000B5C6A7D|nr:type II toxin-antitoxin system VapC family toxin [Nodularia sp. NIES-3585]GAX34693.1 PilT-like protein [Nodularia sp. NIES-3585]
MKKALLDTNILSYFLRGEAQVVNKLREYQKFHSYLSFSILTYYEIKSGLLYKDARNLLQQFEMLANGSEFFLLDIETANVASIIYKDLRHRGLLITPIDLLIAASAIRHKCLLITANVKHFQNIPNLEYENWAVSLL